MTTTAEAAATRSGLIFEQLLEQVRIEIDSALDIIAAADDDARRVCTRAMRFEPDDAALKVITAIAADRALDGRRRELPRRLLAIRVLAEREMGGLFAGSGLDTHRLRRSGVVVMAVLNALDPLDREFQNALSEDGTVDREYLESCRKALSVPREDLCGALILLPRIDAFSSADDESAVRAHAPTLSEGEARRITAFVDGLDGARGEAHRAGFDALVLRSLMDEHLARLEDVVERAEALEASPDNAADENPTGPSREQLLKEIDALLGRVDGDRVAYQFVSRRLQKQKDMALVAGLKSLVEELGHVGKGLFSSYRKLIACSRTLESVQAGNAGAEIVRAEGLFRQAHQAEIEAERRVAADSDEDCLDALRQMYDGDRKMTLRTASRRIKAAAKNRSKPLAAMAAVLLGFSIWFNGDMTKEVGPDAITYADFASGLSVSNFESADGILYVQVNGWNLLDTVQRRTRAEALAGIAESKGYQSLLVAEDNGFPAASWNPERGTKLVAAKFSVPPAR